MHHSQEISILIIEDNPGDQVLLIENLKNTNLSITAINTADNLAAGISYLIKQDFDLIFLDLFLPDSSGLESFSELIKLNSRLPVVIYSGLTDTEMAIKAITLGAQDFLIKGEITTNLLEKTVRYSIERKHNSDALEESNAKYNLISKATHDMVWDWNLVTGEVIRNTEGWKKIFRTDKKTNIGTKEDWQAKIHPDDLEKSNKVFDEIINSQTKELYEMELRILRDDGTIGYIEDRGYVIRNGKGKAIRIIGATLDITERKLAEEKVLLRKQRYKSLVQNGTDLLGVLDAEGNYIYVSPSSTNILGIEPGFFRGKNAFSFIHEGDQEKILASLQEVLSGNLVETPLFRFKNNAGEWRWIESRVTNLLNDPAVEGIVVNSRDVTDKKIAEDKLVLSERRFKSLAQNSSDLLAIINIEGEYKYVSPSIQKILGYDPEFMVGKSSFMFVHEDDQEKTQRFLVENTHKKIAEIPPFRNKTIWGDWRWFEGTMTNLLDDPSVEGIVINTRDVTDKKMADEKLMLSEQRFKSLVQNSADLLSIVNPEGIYTYVSPTSKKILGYDPEFLVGKNGFTFVHEDDRQKMMDFFVANADKKFVETPLFRFKNSAGEWRWIEGSITNILDDPAVGGIVINSRDVTEKKIADDQLSNLSLIAKETINGVMILDDQYKVTWVNTAFTKMSGYELIEISMKSPFEFFPGPETDVSQMGFIKNQLSYKEPFVFEKLDKTKTGDKLFMKVQMQPTFTEHGVVKQYIAIITDVTKQKELEEQVELEKLIKQKEITQAVFTAQENERSHIGRELHDNVNQLLGATHLYIDMSRKNQKDRDSLLDSASTYTYNAIQEIRKLSKTLITPLIKDVGLIDSIKYLTEEIMLVHPIKIVSNTNDYLEEGLSQQFKLNIFRIVQEQINNILKHARAKNIVITISENAGKVLFSIADDGIGFDVGKRKPGIGITNIKSRCELHNCTLKLSSQPGKGTTLSISFNKKDLLKDNAYETIS